MASPRSSGTDEDGIGVDADAAEGGEKVEWQGLGIVDDGDAEVGGRMAELVRAWEAA